MSSLLLSLLAAICTSFSSLFFRKNGDSIHYSNPNGYLALFYFVSFFLSCLLYPDIWNFKINYIILFIGIAVGLLNSLLMILTSRALAIGPAGLIFAFQNSSAIFPGLLLFLLLGPKFGFSYTFLQFAGMALVLFGLFLGAKQKSINESTNAPKWLNYALACFIIQILALTFIQARCILFDCSPDKGFVSNFSLSRADDIWFMPGLFGAGFILQMMVFLKRNKKLQLRDAFYGSLGGVANFASTYLLLLATKLAFPFEKGILFPCFAVASMILCNIWAKKLYKEDFNMKSNMICSMGIFMATAA